MSLLLPAAVCYEIFGPFPMTCQGNTIFEMTTLGALITFNRWYVVGYPVATYKFVVRDLVLHQPLGVLTVVLKLAVNTPVMKKH